MSEQIELMLRREATHDYEYQITPLYNGTLNQNAKYELIYVLSRKSSKFIDIKINSLLKLNRVYRFDNIYAFREELKNTEENKKRMLELIKKANNEMLEK